MRATPRLTLALLGLAAVPAVGAARAQLGGTLSVALVGLHAAADTEEDSPEADTARALVALPLCRLSPGPTPLLVAFSRTGSGPTEEVRLSPRPDARFADGSALRARDVAEAWRRLQREGSPYLALLQPVAGLAEALAAAPQPPEDALRLRLAFPWPDLEASLCHPAFTPFRPRPGSTSAEGVALYGGGPEGRLLASRSAPGGPPFPAALAFSSVQARAAAGLLQRGEVQAVLGEAFGTPASALLYATYLVYNPQGLPAGAREALEAVDTDALVRTFVPGPAAALHALLPPALVDVSPRPVVAPPHAVAPAAGRAFTLGYLAGVPEARAVAERLQVLLHDAGFPVHLHADSPTGLRQGQRAGSVQAALVSVLLPPLPAPALALVLGLAEDEALLRRELPPLGAEADAAARAAAVAQRAHALAGTLPVLPLYVRGLRAGLSDGLLGVHRDGFGLLVLDDAWLGH